MIRQMFRRCLAALFLTLTIGAVPASADEALRDLAGRVAIEAEARAQAFTASPAAPAEAPPPGDPLLADMTDFALAARALSLQIEASGGPQDLRCIFRGMSADIEARIAAPDAARTRAETSRAYTEIAVLARQAERIAADPEASGPAAPSCEASGS